MTGADARILENMPLPCCGGQHSLGAGDTAHLYRYDGAGPVGGVEPAEDLVATLARGAGSDDGIMRSQRGRSVDERDHILLLARGSHQVGPSSGGQDILVTHRLIHHVLAMLRILVNLNQVQLGYERVLRVAQGVLVALRVPHGVLLFAHLLFGFLRL
jgi:hypothetical protein